MRTTPPPVIHILKDFLPLKGYFSENRWALAGGLLSLLTVDFLQLLIPLVIKRAVDSLTYKEATHGILLVCGLMILGIAFLIALFRYIWRLLLFGHSRKVEESLRNRLYSHLQTLPFSFYQKTKTGDIMARATNDIDAIRMATGMGLVALTDGVVLGVAAIGFMIYINLKLTLIALTPSPVLICLARILTRRMSTGYEKVQKSFSALTERVREAFSGIRVIKAYCRESWEQGRVRKEGENYIHENMALARTIAFFFPMMAVFTNAGLAIAIWFGGRLTVLGHMTAGDFVAFIGYLGLLTWPMLAMGWVTNLIQRGAASMRRIKSILDEVPEISDPPVPRQGAKIVGSIRFRSLSFCYAGRPYHALKDIDLAIEAGQTVAVVGSVGSGKTTLLQCIPRFINFSGGEVLIDGVDVRDMALRRLRESIGFATQEAFVFSDTVRNNVLFGRDKLSGSLEQVLSLARIYDDIQDMDHGLETLLGERGITLSGGQRQRLTIARALLSNPAILILDDALSMVDTRTEEQILKGILEARRNRTNLIVSHRLSTISRADLIVVLKEGRVVEMGEHGSLMQMGKEYGRLYEKQLLAQELEVGTG
jgi:ATP-binding cassette subfamily B protein